MHRYSAERHTLQSVPARLNILILRPLYPPGWVAVPGHFDREWRWAMRRRNSMRQSALLLVCALAVTLQLASIVGRADTLGEGKTIVGIAGARFTLNGRLTFLLGFSYYGALGAPEEFIRNDLDGFQRGGFNW